MDSNSVSPVTKLRKTFAACLFLWIFQQTKFVFSGVVKRTKGMSRARKSRSSKAVGYSWFSKLLGLPLEQKLEVMRHAIETEYDIVSANELREKFRRERYLIFQYNHVHLQVPGLMLRVADERNLQNQAPEDSNQEAERKKGPRTRRRSSGKPSISLNLCR